MSYDSYATINSLEETPIISGNEFTLEYEAFDETGAPLDLNAMTVGVNLCPYGDASVVSLTKAGIVSGTIINKFTVLLTALDTINLDGVYLQQPYLTDFSGSSFIPAQGVLIFTPKIKNN